MENFKKLVIGGKFDNNGGSKANKLAELISPIPNCTFLNGGENKDLKFFIKTELTKFDVICNFSNFEDKEKFYSRVRRVNPNIIIIDNVNGALESIKMYIIENHINYLINTTRAENGFLVKFYNKDGEVLKETTAPNEVLCNVFQLVSDDIDLKKREKIADFKRNSILNQAELEKEASDLNQMERLHLRVTNDSISVLYRPLHTYICFVPNNEVGLQEIKRLAELSRDEFKDYLMSNNIRSSKKGVEAATLNSQGSLEEWYQKCWLKNTNDVFNQLNIQNPIEVPLLTVH